VINNDITVPAVKDTGRCAIALVYVQDGTCTVDDGGELWWLRRHRDEARNGLWYDPMVHVEAKEARRMELAKTVEEGGVRCVA
jgi:hypothetical protein